LLSSVFGISYHQDYNKYDLGIKHPLIGDKPQKTMEFLKEKNMLIDFSIFSPEKVEEIDMLRVHDQVYINQLKELNKTGGMLSFDTPAPRGIYDIARLATGGTVLAGRKLFEKYHCTINPLAGFHHASRVSSSGFCFLNDIAIVIENIRNSFQCNRFLIVDLDVHHANGTQEIYFDDPTVLNLSFHQDGRTLYPGTGSIEKIGRDKGSGYTINLPLPPGTGHKSYVHAFDSIVPPLITQFKPEFLIYQCGVDTHHSDPLANLNLLYQSYFYLAKRMATLSSESCQKLLVLFGGGYNSIASIKSYYNIICGLQDKKKYLKEKEQEEANKKEVKEIITKLKEQLEPYWSF